MENGFTYDDFSDANTTKMVLENTIIIIQRGEIYVSQQEIIR